MRIVIFISFLTLSSWNVLLGQNDAYLDELDSIAFQALEQGDTSVVAKANKLLEESAKKNSAPFYTINAHTILGIVSKNKGYYLTALDHNLKALNAAEKIQDEARVSACYNNIGNIHLLLEDYEKACEYFNKSLKLEEKFDRPLQKSIRLYNLGDAYNRRDSFDLALSYFTNSLLIEKKLTNTEGVIYAQLGIADIYVKIERFADAENLLTQINESLEEYQIEERILYEILLGRIHLNRGNYPLSLENFNRAETASLKNNFRIHLLDIYLLKIKAFKALEDWRNATSIYDQLEELKDDLNQEKVKSQLEDKTFQNELMKKELEIKLIQDEKDLAVKNQQMEKNVADHRSKIVWFLVFSLLLLFGLIFIGIRKISGQK
ncbi:MAG: tetratricopeptide repeat protein [Crocinitomicaceae bacterium]|nr:tetratricopeptide repeat protein [Crocinitomicaceae bacterium]